FAHESVAWDPHSGALYLSEDNFGFPSGFYKYVPPAGNDPATEGLADGGDLFMLAVKDQPRANLAKKQPARISYPVEWVPIANPNFESTTVGNWTNDEALTYVSSQGLALGGAKFSRLEGTIYDAGLVYFTSTQGGGAAETTDSDSSDGWGNGWGQIWAYDPRAEVLHLMFESPNRNVLDFPDNVTTSPRGTLVVCEDHDEQNYLRGLTRRGKLVTFAQNLMEGRTSDEFAGSTFGGETLFVNIQASRGLTFAIWGPWESIGV
ncbi:MAG TPA: alkaline phosphatase PhoX, partial [Actinomycetes bacterium]|nr:alkaline phosphatase PhoX [Actinomycetes bacterium]